MTSPLFTSVHIGGRQAPHRLVMAPMTRARSTQPGDVPNAMNARYYAQRASAALIVSEATQVSPQGKGYSFTPGIYSPEQVAGWRLVTQAVHAKGGRIFAQLWHVGRMSHPDFHNGELPVAPSALAFEGKIWKVDPATGRGEMVDSPTPRALDRDEIRGIIADFRRAGRRGHRRVGHHGTVLDQRIEQLRRDRGLALVAAAGVARERASAGASDRRPGDRLRHARYNASLRATLIRAVAFFFFASAYWALLPLVARNQIAGGPELYGILLGAIGIGAVVGAFTLPSMKAPLGSDRLVAAGTLGTALSLILLGVARHSAIGIAACAIAGVSWIAVLASLNVSVQMSLPDWVRGRGLAMFVTVFFGAMTAGSALWGQLASAHGLPAAHFIAAAGAVVGIAATRHWKLLSGAGVDLAASMHWPAPVLAIDADADRGPVLVTVEYRVAPEKRAAFLVAIRNLGRQRRRDGAYTWDVYENGRFLETFVVASWLEHLRQHHRVTNADRVVQDAIREFDAEAEPKVTHFIAASFGPSNELQ